MVKAGITTGYAVGMIPDAADSFGPTIPFDTNFIAAAREVLFITPVQHQSVDLVVRLSLSGSTDWIFAEQGVSA